MENDNFYFEFSASLRIMDSPEIYDELTAKIKPSHTHKIGDLRNEKTNKKWENNIWMLSSPLSKDKKLSEHLLWIWNEIEPHIEYLSELQEKKINMDLFCGFRTDCETGGFTIEPIVYEMLIKLKIPIGFSVIIA